MTVTYQWADTERLLDLYDMAASVKDNAGALWWLDCYLRMVGIKS